MITKSREQLLKEYETARLRLIGSMDEAPRPAVTPARVLKTAVRVILVLLLFVGAFTVLVLSVEAIRIPVINFCIELYENGADTTEPPVLEPGDRNSAYVTEGPLAGALSGAFYLERHETYRNGMLIAVYKNENGCTVTYSVRLSSAHINIDTQNADSRFLIINDKYGLYTQKESYQSFWWQDEEQNTVCLLESHNMDVADFMLLLEKYV